MMRWIVAWSIYVLIYSALVVIPMIATINVAVTRGQWVAPLLVAPFLALLFLPQIVTGFRNARREWAIWMYWRTRDKTEGHKVAS